MNQLRAKRPREALASPSRKTMSPSWSTSRPHRFQRIIAGVTGSAGRWPADRARLAAGPQKLPDQAGGIIQSIVASAPPSSFQSAIIQQKNQIKVGLLVRPREPMPERPAPPRTSSGSGEA